jgi:diguanylate cyclase (GGDEF)-like protein
MTLAHVAEATAVRHDAAAVAQQILSEIGDAPESERNRLLLERALAAAAQAQQTLADQRQRIAELEALSVTDELTGLANRRGFTMAANHALATMRRHGGTTALILVDLDDFKDINDTFGHAAGDYILCHVGQMLRGHVRDTDTVARIGGDEFALLLPGASPDLARYRASALTRVIDRAVARWQHALIPLAASFGLAQITAADTLADAIEQADQSMYRLKRERCGAGSPINARSAAAPVP